MSESADNGLQLYKREPLPPLTKDVEPSQSDVEVEGEKSGSRSTTGDIDMEGPAPPPAPPLPPSSGGSSPSSLRKVVNDDDSKKSSPASITPKTNSGPGVQRPTIDISQAQLKPVVQQPKPQHMPESPLYQFQLPKMAHGGSKDQVSTNKNTDQETDSQESSTSYQPKSPKSKKFHLPYWHVPI
ncbi:hypothetical protein BSLG_003579 [Batrachochytrium salamandrivorans]|nr:hypothetical protein BSLG_003579 [Batrachochytrium salamandrivorans]